MTVEAKKVRVYEAADGWRWHAQDDNNEIVAESGEAYGDKAFCITAATDLFPDAIHTVEGERWQAGDIL